jgi:L-cysteine:1D-myo-inositol 2-amino-2-deoxy-alpha-D-glucopyranoside ligase
MIGLDGEKMSKSKGNLVFVSRLRGDGVDPMAVRLALMSWHYRSDRQWTDEMLKVGERRLATWRAAAAASSGPSQRAVVDELRAAVADDLDTPRALSVVDRWADEALAAGGTDGTALVAQACDALLGVRL